MSAYPAVKRAIDIAVSATGLAVAAPVMGAVALGIRRKLGSPVLFRQQRPGLDGRPFELVKFRTMLTPEQAEGLSDDAARLTPFGAWLRSTSLDELPTLWNVLRGDMSIIGPRPLLMSYLPLYSAEQARRHDVRPGVTGLAQVSGRNALSWEDKFALDVDYVRTMSLATDLRIVARTIVTVMRRDGITAADNATMPAFTGTPVEVPA